MSKIDIILEKAKRIDIVFYETLKEVIELCQYDSRWNEEDDDE